MITRAGTKEENGNVTNSPHDHNVCEYGQETKVFLFGPARHDGNVGTESECQEVTRRHVKELSSVNGQDLHGDISISVDSE